MGRLPPPGLLLKRLLLFFWTVFFAMIALSNLVDWLGEIGVLDWTFMDSNNFGYLRSVVDVYDVGAGATKALLFGAFLIETIGAILFGAALLRFRSGEAGSRLAIYAVCWSILAWSAFIFAVELFVAFEAESVFRELLLLSVVSGMAVVVIPDDVPGPARND